MRRTLSAIAVTICVTGGGDFSPAVAQEQSYGGLPPGDGREIVYGICNACHSVKLVTQQGMSRARWDHLLDWMVEQQGMPELDAETRETVLDYLSEHFGEDGANGAEGGVSPYNQPQPLLPAE